MDTKLRHGTMARRESPTTWEIEGFSACCLMATSSVLTPPLLTKKCNYERND